jgi:hypothetical protein
VSCFFLYMYILSELLERRKLKLLAPKVQSRERAVVGRRKLVKVWIVCVA